ncbi:MAG: stage II sporulation protein M [Bacteroidota bacterium]
MREPAFLKNNKDTWLEYEKSLEEEGQKLDPDRLAKLYIQLTDDLAYARTFYPKSKIVKYLNGLAARTHLLIYTHKREDRKRIGHFWVEELPQIFWEARKYLLYSFLIFTLSFSIGMLSANYQSDFLRVVLGDGYVNMTIENIRKGDPLGVYSSMEGVPMFVYIAYNNIRVLFMTYAAGMFFSIGTAWILFQNGLMLGAFLGFFQQYNLLWEAIPVIYIHGTLEISAIVIAGGAGIMLGNGILFPGTYTRIQSLRKAANKSMKVIIGLVPVIVAAAILESFVTRFTQMPLWVKLAIILVSLCYIIGYYGVYPWYKYREQILNE